MSGAAGSTAEEERPGRVSWPLVVAGFTYLALLARGDELLSGPDMLWHVAAGRWMLEHGEILRSDPFSHTMPGVEWSAHEWLSEIVLALTYDLGGWTLLGALAAAAAALALAFLTRFLIDRLAPLHAVLLAALSLMLLAPHMLARPHTLALPLFALWTVELFRASEAGRRPSWWLLPVMALWANLHGGFTFGLALVPAVFLDAWLRASPGRRRELAREWGLFFAGALVVAVVTPHGAEGLLIPFEVLSDEYSLTVIQEWRSPNFQEFQPLEVFLLLVVGIALLRGLKLPPARLLIFLGLIHLALRHVRHVDLMAVVAPLLLAAPVAAQLRPRYGEGESGGALDAFFRRLARPARASSWLTAALLCAAVTVPAVRAGWAEPPAENTPDAALETARRAGAEGNVLNSYGLGGFLIFRGVPVAIDGRADMYEDPFLIEYSRATQLAVPGALQSFLEEHDIGWTMLAPGTAAVALLDELPGWERVHRGPHAVVHVRR